LPCEAEDAAHARHVSDPCAFESKLTVDRSGAALGAGLPSPGWRLVLTIRIAAVPGNGTVVAQSPVGGRRDDALDAHAIGDHLPHEGTTIADVCLVDPFGHAAIIQ